MPLNLPSFNTIITRIRADVRSLLAALDPTIFGSLIRAITDSNAGRHFDNVLSLQQLEKNLFPSADAPRETNVFWMKYEGLLPFEATQAVGNGVFVGVVGSTIDEDQEFRSAAGNIYIADETVDISANTIAVTSLTRSGSTVTVVTGSEHNFATGIEVTMAGAVETDYNGDFDIIVIDGTSFSYEIETTPSTPATGTITASCDCASVPVISEDFGLELNLDSGATLTATSSISGVESEGFADADGITGGQNEETSLSIYNRTVQSRANPVANFNVSAITLAALSVQGVTRVKVKRVTPDVGDVTILFVRDDDDNIIPSASEVADVEDKILENLQATSEETDVYVTAPTPVETDYTFGAIVPDTTTMRKAVTKNIQAFYTDDVTFEVDIQEDKYRAAITNTIDPDTGDTLSSFTLSGPSGDITVGTDKIGIPGDITF